MAHDFKRIGDFITVLDNRNSDGIVDNLMGISIDKCYIPSVANVIGTDLRNYKVIRRGQFACSLMQVSRDQRIPIAMYADKTPAIMSPAYVVFEVDKPNKILPEYMELWFRRAEFDREASFYAVGGVRGSLDWEDFCNMKLPVPSIEEQRKIVDAYQVTIDRIMLLKMINDNLRAWGLSIIEKTIGTAALINKTQSELDSITLPGGCVIKTVSDYCRETKSGATPSRTEQDYWDNGTIPWLKSGEVHNGIILKTEESISQSGLDNSSTKVLPANTVLMAMYGVTAGEVGYLAIPATTNQAICGMVCNTPSEAAYLFFALLQGQSAASRLSNGGAQDNLSKAFIDSIHLICPPADEICKLGLSSIIETMMLYTKEIDCLEQLQSTLLSLMTSC